VGYPDMNVLAIDAGSRHWYGEAVFPRFTEHEALSIPPPRGLDQRNMAYCAYTLASLLFLPSYMGLVDMRTSQKGSSIRSSSLGLQLCKSN
jgi:hypothetical protein